MREKFYFWSDSSRLFRYLRHLAINVKALLLHRTKIKQKKQKLKKSHQKWVKSVIKVGAMEVYELVTTNETNEICQQTNFVNLWHNNWKFLFKFFGRYVPENTKYKQRELFTRQETNCHNISLIATFPSNIVFCKKLVVSRISDKSEIK